jgi:hypothetical protein
LLKEERNGIVASGEGDNNGLEEKVPAPEQRFPGYIQNGRSGKV